MACPREQPCGGVLIQDAAQNRALAQYRIGRFIERCVNGHSHISDVSVPELPVTEHKEKCPQCKELFWWKHSIQEFCSNKCSATWRENHNGRRKPTLTIACRQCEKKFTTRNRRRLFCSLRCATKYNAKHRHHHSTNAFWEHKRPCGDCHKAFTTRNGFQKRCDPCRKRRMAVKSGRT